ncbi:MAG TPA: trypsin-like peptidase domain-containing protein [Pirellulales bacterium]|nr:trypsin-like peptidase domain-containing protein [Pirellulales bacterium]
MQEPIYSPPHERRLARLLWILTALCLALVLPYLAGRVQYSMTRAQLRAKAEAAAEELTRLDKNAELVKLSDTSKAFRLVASRIEPSVVHIDTVQSIEVRQARSLDEWGFQFPPQGKRFYRAQGQGSGVIVDAEEGYVLTNYHVVHNASQVQVKLSDGRTIDSNSIQMVGYDVLTDLAVLRLQAGDLSAAPWGDSDELEVGDWVLAVGNPYGLDRTVTSGIVSAKQRGGLNSDNIYQTFLQTDAAVNPGNSGGPLVNIRGELVGITTAIVGDAYQGISFAIPTEVVRKVYDRLKEHGKVARGWLGVQLQELTPELVKRLDLKEPRGALVAGVLPGSPAADAGLQPGDVIVSWNGQKVTDSTALPLQVAATEVGAKVTVEVIRAGQTVPLTVTIGERPEETTLRQRR